MRARKAIAAVSAAGLAVLGGVLTAPAAQAGNYGCAGSLSWSSTVNDVNGSKAGTIYDYFDGTTNCSVFVKSVYAGVSTHMAMDISNAKGAQSKVDDGQFTTYAGPVRVAGTGTGTCVREWVWMTTPGGSVLVNYTAPWHSCG
ncbi:hypothetical protein [Kitasatospora arboriphila]|uniref:Uncharacterized protein n=1 Tax=Kitasatospora arboriphila TaxID=258052 RepID=A0ABP4E442_9ACTN